MTIFAAKQLKLRTVQLLLSPLLLHLRRKDSGFASASVGLSLLLVGERLGVVFGWVETGEGLALGLHGPQRGLPPTVQDVVLLCKKECESEGPGQ